MVTVEPSELSKKALVELVDQLLKARVIGTEIIVLFFKHDQRSQLQLFAEKLDKIDKKLKRKRLSLKRHNELIREFNRITTTGARKLKRLKALEQEEEL